MDYKNHLARCKPPCSHSLRGMKKNNEMPQPPPGMVAKNAAAKIVTTKDDHHRATKQPTKSPSPSPVIADMLKKRALASTPYINGRPSKNRTSGNPVRSPPGQQQRQSINTDKFTNPNDICCVALVCDQHHKLAMLNSADKGLFLPYLSFRMETNSLCVILKDLIGKIIDFPRVGFRNFQMCTDRIQIPKSENFIHRIIYRIDVSFPKKPQTKPVKSRSLKQRKKILLRSRSCSNTGSRKNKSRPKSRRPVKSKMSGGRCVCQAAAKKAYWFSLAEIQQRISWLWGPEPRHIIDRGVTKTAAGPLDQQQHHCSIWCETTLEDFWNDIQISPAALEVLKCASFLPADVFSLYNEFVIQCLPSRFMGLRSFKIFLQKIGLSDCRESKIIQYFNSFDFSKMSYLRFSDLLLGLAIFRRKLNNCQHQHCLIQRHAYFFRYFATANRERLNLDDLCRIVMEFLQNQPGKTIAAVAMSLENERKLLGEIKKRLSIRFAAETELKLTEFFQLAINKRFFPLLGIQTTVDEFLDRKLCLYCDITALMPPVLRWQLCQSSLTASQRLVLARLYDRRCDACNRKRFYLSAHLLTLSEIGEVSEIRRMVENDKQQTQSIGKEIRQDIAESDIHVLANDIVGKINRFALYTFGTDEVPESETGQLANWFFATQDELLKNCKSILAKVERILGRESRVLALSSPCCIMGDIHGNLRDLLLYSQVIWKSSPFVNQSKYLFLGDYVDRGSYGVECVMYLFCLKILAPKHFFILRGNHEVREIQEQFSFFEECITRFSIDLWEAINSALDVLPIAAVLDDQLFCAHGGIPYSGNTIDQFRSIPSPLENPIDSNIAWEILWNDPVSPADFQNIATFERATRFDVGHGFTKNIKRGTAYQFGEIATIRFLEKNRLEYIIRAHEVFDDGFHFHHKGRVITVFSSSKYSEMDNRSAFIFVDRNKIRVVQIKDE